MDHHRHRPRCWGVITAVCGFIAGIDGAVYSVVAVNRDAILADAGDRRSGSGFCLRRHYRFPGPFAEDAVIAVCIRGTPFTGTSSQKSVSSLAVVPGVTGVAAAYAEIGGLIAGLGASQNKALSGQSTGVPAWHLHRIADLAAVAV